VDTVSARAVCESSAIAIIDTVGSNLLQPNNFLNMLITPPTGA
jgi:hypothetical protein